MSQKIALTFAVIGFVAAAYAVILHRKGTNRPKEVMLLAVAAGLCFGTAGAALAGIDITKYRIGYIPVWTIAVAIFGLIVILEFRGYKDHPIRTPLLGFVTALLLMMATGGLAHIAKATVHNLQPTAYATHLSHHHHHRHGKG